MMKKAKSLTGNGRRKNSFSFGHLTYFVGHIVAVGGHT